MKKAILLLLLFTLLMPLGALHADPAFLTKGQKPKVMCVGDSITLGKYSMVGGYRRILYEWLIANGYSITYVGKQNLQINKSYPNLNASDGSILWHEGYGSLRSDQVLNGGSVERQTAPPIATTLQNYQPDIVLLMIGTNDILQNYQIDTLNDRLGQIIDAIYAYNPKTIVLVASIAPITNPAKADKEKLVEAYNAAIPGIVAKEQAQGRQIAFVNIHDALTGRYDMDRDGVHPSPMGYAHMAQAWYKALTGEDAPAVDPNNHNPLMLPPPVKLPPPPPKNPPGVMTTSNGTPVSATSNSASPAATTGTNASVPAVH